MECLGEETVSNVLSRLPAKDLMRCKCVCKSWFDLITDPHFISNYYAFYNNQQEKEHLLLNRKQAGISILSWNPKEPKGLVSSQVLNPLPYQYGWGEIMGPCNGIYFLQGIPGVIMNPSLRQYIPIPKSHFTAPHGTYSMSDCFIFGFDPKTDDYKVVVLKDLWLGLERMRRPLIGEWTVELYSLNSNSWKNLGAHAIPFPFAIRELFELRTYVNNCCHLWGYVYESDEDESDDDIENVVLSFDMVNESFRKIKVPKITYSSGQYVEKLASFSEYATIGLIVFPLPQNRGTDGCFCFDVWIMKDYWDEGSWIKHYNIGHLPVIHKQLVGVYGSDCFLCKDTNDTLVLHDPHREEHTITRDLQVYENHELTGAARYMESLVSLQRVVGCVQLT